MPPPPSTTTPTPARDQIRAVLSRLVPDEAGAAHLARWLDGAPGMVDVTATAPFDLVRLESDSAWAEAGRDGLDEGWREPAEVPIDHAVLRAPVHPIRARVLGWAVDHGLPSCRAVRGSERGGWTELRVALPAWPADRTLSAVREAFTRFEVRWLGDQVALAMTVGSFGSAELVVAWSEDGVHRLGVCFVEPPIDLSLRLARALLVADDPRSDVLEDALGVEPTVITCVRSGAAVDLEFTWRPAP